MWFFYAWERVVRRRGDHAASPQENRIKMAPECTLQEMLSKFEVKKDDNGRYLAEALSGGRGVVDASQILAQSIVAATHECPGMRVASVSMIFAKTMKEEGHVELQLDSINIGRSFASFSVDAIQNGRCCARGIMMLDTNEPDFVSHQINMPVVPSPEDSKAIEMPLEGRELRLTEDLDLMFGKQAGPATLDIWARYASGSDNYAVNQALVAHLSNHFSISTALRPHDQLCLAGAHRDFSAGVLSLAVTFHAPADLNDWLLYSHKCTYAGRGVSFTRADVFTRAGQLIASFTQESMLRGMPQRDSARAGSAVL